MKNILKKTLSCFLLTGLCVTANAQKKTSYKFVDGKTLSISGQASYLKFANYQRVDSADLVGLPASVKQLATNSAGLNLTFQTNSKSIAVKWRVRKYDVMANMTPIGINGLDLYGWNGKYWQFVAAAKPNSKENSVTFISDLDGKMRHYKVYLPLYSELQDLEIGVDSNSTIKAADPEYLPKKKVVIYGSSITQGASASRPGMAYPSMLSRRLNVETFNLGFSGSGKMEIEIVDILAKIPADLYILDCVPNPSPEQIKQRSYPFISKLRKLKPGVPILMIESVTREGSNWSSTVHHTVTSQNQEFRNTYERLIKEKYKDIYYITTGQLTGDDHEASVDGTHLSDLGFYRFVQPVQESVKKILNL